MLHFSLTFSKLSSSEFQFYFFSHGHFFVAFYSSFLISFPLFQTTSTRTSRTRAWCRPRRPNTTWVTWSVARSAPGYSPTATAGTAACRVLTSLGSTRETSPATTPSGSRSVILQNSVVLETLHLGRLNKYWIHQVTKTKQVESHTIPSHSFQMNLRSARHVNMRFILNKVN